MRVKGRLVGAHRVSWEIHNGPIPKGKWVLHKCDNPPCIRPKHLFLGTRLDNVRDMEMKGRRSAARGEKHGRSTKPERNTVGERNRHAKLTDDQVREIRKIASVESIAYVDLAKRFGVGDVAISRIVNRKTWRHL